MLAELRRLGIRRALVAASGDLAIGDPPPGERGWRVGLGSGGSVELLRNCGVSTSGDSEQYAELGGVRYSHIIDPRSGWALRDSQPVTVVAKTASLADALATAGSVDPQTPAVSAYGARIIR
jgi:thiamine biosynthesis lipoprotein